MPTDNNFLTPTYQIFFNSCITNIANCLAKKENMAAWRWLQTFFNGLPPNCEDEVKTLFNEVNTRLQEISKTKMPDPLFKDSDIQTLQDVYLEMACLDFFHKIKVSLIDKGYLVFESGRPATRENSLRDFELTVNKAMYGSK